MPKSWPEDEYRSAEGDGGAVILSTSKGCRAA